MHLSDTDRLLISLDKAVKADPTNCELIQISKLEASRLVELSKIGLLVERKKFDHIWERLFPNKAINLLSMEDLSKFLDTLKVALSHTCSMIRVAENRQELERAIDVKPQNKPREDSVEPRSLAQAQADHEKGCVLPSLGCLP